jgi:hypothetical protein
LFRWILPQVFPPNKPAEARNPIEQTHKNTVPVSGVLKLAVASRFSERWFTDALDQSQLPGPDARRREIVFAVCLAESYLFECVVHDVFPNDWDGALKYFAPSARGGVDQKWREVPKKLFADRKLRAVPDLGGPHGEDWAKLVDLRDALIHAVVSRPVTRQADDPTPLRSPSLTLAGIPPGWALRVVVDRITRFHAAAGSQPAAPARTVRPG